MFQENYIENYMALLACITSEKFLSANSAIRQITLENVDVKNVRTKNREINCKRMSSKKAIKIIVIDTLENKEHEFKSIAAAERSLKVNKGTIAQYTKANRIYKKRYIFKKIEGEANEH
ncbi:NUMOD1 domain-containing DNA-binding protein [Romboutsia sp. 1001216sp1]|uniref:NUMOD1 domain-containing DNA-binding protein n=1 Tax=unclassified Romboutsia TaxID=2626894 RepID=UPI00189E3BF0|nr:MULTISPECIES: NUMOD1 domain-containing DNA-binding protein [unclassified Romboutsia]MDB8790654.1 NUMOD1 domain-containing DNA-binding protein [Romboutsia sp. 1001216sp1]MDB8803273.1 NUMOD1 domain-containing DNA-binding protein [Romboutsia sp. 1001216sp1]MDB8814619.1 NUMOD1 domain-containing DNA-binding protein [Romboutsia sp. 1001216sp1]